MRSALAVLAVALLAVAGWFLLDKDSAQPVVAAPQASAPESLPAPSSSATEPAVKPSKQTEASSLSRAEDVQSPRRPVLSADAADASDRLDALLNSGDFDHVRPQLEELALAGDPLAALWLSSIYQRCVHQPVGDPAQRLDKELRSLMDEKDLKRYREQASYENMCGGLGEIEPAGAQNKYWKWLELAADNGSARAMHEYSKWVIRTWPDVTGRKRYGGNWPSALGDAEQIVRYRNKAIGYLERAYSMGSVYALAGMAREYGEAGTLFPPDLVRAYAYALAFQSAATSRFDRQQAVYQLTLRAKRMNAEQIAEAERLSVDILADLYDGAGK